MSIKNFKSIVEEKEKNRKMGLEHFLYDWKMEEKRKKQEGLRRQKCYVENIKDHAYLDYERW